MLRNMILTPGDKLRIYRKVSGMTMEQLGSKLEIKNARTVISLHEVGKNGLKNRKDKLGNIFNVNPNEFITNSTLEYFMRKHQMDDLLMLLDISDKMKIAFLNQIFTKFLKKT